ncbi:TetR/AcrR family transcriptional regulator [Paramicrobacterium fandaimingii]|uniref:TetR/AcrR family transcriptional regulator n=1 Tax=Paramicrobacterium fandaimingii TaxID=2708079 RepID=UPI00141D9F05|nr:TetR/AcrR family transcriptional regulator [Microbacterium fandaimingii]
MVSSTPDAGSARRQKTRDRLLDAAYDVFAEVGVDAAPVELVVERAGFTRGAFYSNFESKNELFVALAERENDRRMAQVQVGLDTVLPGLDGEALSRLTMTERVDVITGLVADFLKLQGDDKQWCVIESEFRVHALRNADFGRYLVEHETEMQRQLAQVLETTLLNFGQRFVVDPLVAVRIITTAYKDVTVRGLLAGTGIPAQSDSELHNVIASVVALFTEPTAPTHATS